MIQQKKSDLRSFYRQKLLNSKSSLRAQEPKIIDNLLALNLWHSGKVVAAYQALHDEACLQIFFEKCTSCSFVFPRMREEQLEFYHVKNKDLQNKDSFQKNSFSVLEPIPEQHQKVHPTDISIFLIPGRVFDREGGRLGRGLACYDKVLPASTLKIAVAFNEQIHNDPLPLESTDIVMDLIVTAQFVLIPKINFFDTFNHRVVVNG